MTSMKQWNTHTDFENEALLYDYKDSDSDKKELVMIKFKTTRIDYWIKYYE